MDVVHGSLNCAVSTPGELPPHQASLRPNHRPNHSIKPTSKSRAGSAQPAGQAHLEMFGKGMGNSKRVPLTPPSPQNSPFLALSDNLREKIVRDGEARRLWVLPECSPHGGQHLGRPKNEGEGFSAPSRSWEPSEQQDLLTLHPQRIKSPSRRGAIWKRFCDRNFSSINP